MLFSLTKCIVALLLPVAGLSILTNICRTSAGQHNFRETRVVKRSASIPSVANRRPASPAVFLDTTEVRSTGRKIAVSGGASASRDFQLALEQASPGDVIQLQAGAVF